MDQTTLNDIATNLEDISASLAEQVALLKAELGEAPVQERVVQAGEDLQAALAEGVPLTLDGVFAGSFTLPTGTSITGRPGAALRGDTAPAILILPGTTDVSVTDLEVTSKHPEVIRVGDNTDAQTTVAQAPQRITFTRVIVPSHRGKRAFALHGSNISLIDCQALDVWDPAGQDSQAIYVGNAPGPITVRGGRYSAGSEVFISGGGATKIPDLTPEDILVENVELFRPLSWKTDGVARKVKNIFEIKNGRRVILRNSTLSGCWKQGQQGEAIMLTPALDGADVMKPLRSGELANVLIEDVTISDCSSVASIVGRDYAAYTVNATSGVVFRRVTSSVSLALYGGRGQFAIIQGEPVDILVEDCTHVGDGTSTIYSSAGTVLDPVTKASRAAGKIGLLRVINSRMKLGKYGFNLEGSPNAVNWQAAVTALDVQGNAFTGYTAMKPQLPNNTYV